MATPGGLRMLARLYWYMVEFGLIRTASGLRVYGAGILSSKGETVYSIESPEPQRLDFDLVRVMRTDYRIDEFQRTYFVLDSFEQLFEACYDTDFAPMYRAVRRAAADCGRRPAGLALETRLRLWTRAPRAPCGHAVPDGPVTVLDAQRGRAADKNRRTAWEWPRCA